MVFEQLTPMLLSSAKAVPADDRSWAFELKWDGMRTLCCVRDGEVLVRSRRGTDYREAFPELQELARAVGGRSVVMDGELVCVSAEGRPSFSRIRRRWAPGAACRAAELARALPATFVAFDLLVLDGVSLMGRSYQERRERLGELALRDRHWLTTAYHVGDGAGLLRASREQRLEGIVAKKLTSVYRPGARSAEWLKMKNYERGELLVGGWLVDGAGNVEALLVGRVDGARLVYSGTVEFGLERQRRRLREVLELLAVSRRPFEGSRKGAGRPTSARMRYVEPRLVATVRYIGWDAGLLREAILERMAPA